MDFKGLIGFLISSFITPAITLIVGAAVVFFLWNIFNIIRKSDQPDELAKLKSQATWGIVAIAIMVSVWGLVNFVVNSFNPNNTRTPVPQLNTNTGTNTPLPSYNGNPLPTANSSVIGPNGTAVPAYNGTAIPAPNSSSIPNPLPF